jgi:NhaP-type Na+/H+ or K+/H+ antiporter
MIAGVGVFALLVILFVSQSARLGRVYLTGPIVFVVGGAVLGRTLFSGEVDSTTIRTVAEVTLALMLFHDAAQLQPRQLRGSFVFTGRLLLVGLPLTIGAGYLVARGLFPELGVWLALLLAAALAPTDAGLGAATVLNPVVPVRVRRILNVESGLNDGLATPVVLFAIAATAGGSPEGAAIHAVREIGVGALLGVLAGILCGWLLERARTSGWAQPGLVPIAALAVPLLCYYGAVSLGGNGYIAAFVAGTAFASAQSSVEHVNVSLEMTDLVSAFLGYAVWFLVGITAAGNLGSFLRWQTLLFAALSLTVLRMVPVALSLVGSRLRPQTVVFVGWFGPRGLASVVFALIAYESLGATTEVATALGVITTTVVLSVIVHGISAAPWARRYGEWAHRSRPEVESQHAAEPLPVRRSPRPSSREETHS